MSEVVGESTAERPAPASVGNPVVAPMAVTKGHVAGNVGTKVVHVLFRREPLTPPSPEANMAETPQAPSCPNKLHKVLNIILDH